jgi:hypothetical protein
MDPARQLRVVSAAISFLLLLGAAEVGSFAALSAAENDSDQAIARPAAEESTVVISGNASVLRPPDGWWGYLPFVNDDPTVCTDFFIRTRAGEVRDLELTSTGLGPARFALKPTDNQLSPGNSASAARNSNGELSLVVPQLGRTEQPVNLCLQIKRLVPLPGTTAEGKILIIDGNKTQALPIKLENPSAPPLYTAMQWFFGIVIPALLSFLAAWGLTELNSSRNQRAREQQRFERFKARRYQTLKDFFTAYYQNLSEANEEFPTQLRENLLTRNYWVYIPSRKLSALEQAISRRQRSEIGRVLAELFPDWREAILKSAPLPRRTISHRLGRLMGDLKKATRNFFSAQLYDETPQEPLSEEPEKQEDE